MSDRQVDAKQFGTWSVAVTSVPLPSNAAQETGGNLATAVANLTTLLGLLLTQGASAAAATGPMVVAKISDSSEAYRDGTVEPISLTPDGRLRVATIGESSNYTPWGSSETWGSDGSDDNFGLSAW